MNPEDLAAILDELGRRLGPTGERVFELAVRQVYINAATTLVVFVALVAVGLYYRPRLLAWVADGNSYSDRDLAATLIAFAYGIGLVVAGLLVMWLVPSVLNPEYAAIQNLLSALAR